MTTSFTLVDSDSGVRDDKERRLSIATNSLFHSLLDAELNKIDLFEDQCQKRDFQHSLSKISTTRMSKKEIYQINCSIRSIQKNLENIKVSSNFSKILILTKIFDDEPIIHTFNLLNFLLTLNPALTVFIQYEFKEFDTFKQLLIDYPEFKDKIDFWYTDRSYHPPEFFDLIVTLGGDGTILFASYLFQRICPPILSFSLGSLSFLTEFEIDDHQSIFKNVFNDGYQCSIRLRFECAIIRHKDRTSPDSSTINFPVQKHEFSFTVLNEVVIDRGPNSTMTALQIFNDDEKLTTVEADGLIISTPTGSTAYSLSAGGSLVHPEIPGILISPICPHTLSFRPLIVPEQMILRISVPLTARATAWCSFDGKNRVELGRGDFLTITTSKYPITFINNADKNVRNSWFSRLSETLHWNERKPQKPLKQAF